MERHLNDSRRGKNTQLPLVDLLRQSIYSRLAGYEDVNDAERLSQDPAFRLIGSRKIWERGAALTSRLQSFETEVLTQEKNLAGLAALNRELVGKAEAIDSPRRVLGENGIFSRRGPVRRETGPYPHYWEHCGTKPVKALHREAVRSIGRLGIGKSKRKSRVNHFPRSMPGASMEKNMSNLRFKNFLFVLGFSALIIFSTATYSAAEDSQPQALANFAAANRVIGQPDFTSNQCDQGGSPAANNFCAQEGTMIQVGKKKLYAADSNQNRILGFKKFPTKNGASANFVLGQPNFSSSGSGASATELGYPVGMASDGKRLFVADFDNSRVLIWNKLPTKTDAPANVVVGQPTLTSSSPATTQSGLDLPEGGVAVAKGMLFVGDRNNNRVMIWNHIPTTNGANADVVVGQPDFTSSGSGTSQTEMGEVEAVWSNGTKLVVADSFNNRVLIWNSIPTTNGAPADVVVGQADFTSFAAPSPPTAESLDRPFGVTSDGSRLFVADSDNNRVLMYSPFPTSNNPTATLVLGQPDFVHGDANAGGSTSAQSLDFPFSISLGAGHLFVGDYDNSRFLVFDNP